MNWEAVNENTISVNIKHLGNKITVLCAYAPSNEKSKFQIHDVRVERVINCESDHYVVRPKVYLPIRGRTSNTDKHEENYGTFMYLK